MSTRTYYLPRDLQIDLAHSPKWLYDEIASLHGRIVKGRSPLVCVGNGAEMYVYLNSRGRYFARHYPGENSDGHSHAIATMSDEHRRQTDYAARAADDHGLEIQIERPTGRGTRLDLAVVGAVNTGFEIQRSVLTRANAEQRAARSFEAGWQTAWVSDSEKEPSWSGYVPTARFPAGRDREAWKKALPGRNTIRVIIGRFTRVRDRSRRSGWGYNRQPEQVLYDDLAYMMPAGEIVPVSVGSRGEVSLAFRDAIDVIDSCAFPGASRWDPNTKTTRTKEAPQQFSTTCHHECGAASRPYQRCPHCGEDLTNAGHRFHLLGFRCFRCEQAVAPRVL